MVVSKDERETHAEFAGRYQTRASLGMVDEVEREVIGEVWAANGFTTVAEADELRRRLDLRAESRLIDVGSGCGWPGLYLARESGCEVLITDMPTAGLEVAFRRARAEGLKSLGVVATSARHFPFVEGSFDALVHTDVIC